jgi:hypothetical protein
MSRGNENLVTAELCALEDEELAWRVKERRRQLREYPHSALIKTIAENDLVAIVEEAQKRGLVLESTFSDLS